MYLFQQEGRRPRTGSTRHREVLARLLAITRRQFTAPQPATQPPVAPPPVCDGAGFEDRLHASLATLGRNDTRVAERPAFGRAPLRAFDRNREQRPSPGPNGGLVAWIEFDALEAVDSRQAERAADEMHAIVRERIDECGSDGFVGRYGVESFAWAQVGAMTLERAVALADAMLEALSAPARVATSDVSLCPSLGFTWFPEDGTSPAMLLSRACAAMRRARHYGMGYAFYSPILDTAFASPVGITYGMAHGSRRARAGRRCDVPRQAPAHRLRVLRVGADAPGSRRRRDLGAGCLATACGPMMVLSSAAPPAACTPDAAPAPGDATEARLLAMVAHELRKPLSPIAIAASLLREAAGDARKLAHLQSVIERQVEHLTRVIADLTDTTRVRTGSLSIERRTIATTAFVRQAADACRASLDSRGQRLVLRLPQRPFRLHADPGRLVQILTNLIDNASKFSERGTSIVVSLAVDSSTSELAVEDVGIGIAPESLATLFDASAQQARRIRPRGAGMGLGLSIVRVLAEAHGGSVRATSAGEGRGTRFVVLREPPPRRCVGGEPPPGMRGRWIRRRREVPSKAACHRAADA